VNITLVCHKYDVSLDDPCCYPLGYMYVSSLLKQQGHNVKILNYNLWDYDLLEEIKHQDIVMFTGFEEFKDKIIRDAMVCKALDIKTALGGALATFLYNEMSQYIDFVYAGEIDAYIPIDKIVFPDYEGFQVSEYHNRNSIKHIGILTSRGCPFHCTFCAQTCVFRSRSVSKVFEEIDLYISKYKPDLLVFNDNTFNIRKDRFIQFCTGMKDRKQPWVASIRCDVFDEDMAKAASGSECKGFIVGVESFNQSKLDSMNKHIKVNDIYKTFDLLIKYNIRCRGNILVGFENETYQDVVREIASIPNKYNIAPTLVHPFIGTSNGKQRLLSAEEVSYLNSIFSEYIQDIGLQSHFSS
jgi:radical SAM superfamily enzyme YgiQ (UPF0313 family)